MDRHRASWSSALAGELQPLDYSSYTAPGRYDGVIFNETLYCFDDPVATVGKSIAENMHAGSLLIVSMYGEHHEPIWNAIASRCDTVDEQVVGNSDRVRWRIRALRPAGRPFDYIGQSKR